EPYRQMMFFFSSRRMHTRFARDWSSDVCSSDLEDEGDLALGSGLDQLLADGHLGAVVEAHDVRQVAEIRLVHVEHVLHRLGGHADRKSVGQAGGAEPARCAARTWTSWPSDALDA